MLALELLNGYLFCQTLIWNHALDLCFKYTENIAFLDGAAEFVGGHLWPISNNLP